MVSADAFSATLLLYTDERATRVGKHAHASRPSPSRSSFFHLRVMPSAVFRSTLHLH